MREIERCCQILGLKMGASLAEVKEAYRDLVHVWHPDRFSQNPRLQKKAEAMLREINAAYEIILSCLESAAAVTNNQVQPSPAPPNSAAHRSGGRSQTKTSARQVVLTLKKLIRQHPQDPEAYYNLGMAYLHLGRNLEALETLQKLLTLEPGSAATYLGLGVALCRLGRDQQAVTAFRRAQALKPDDPLCFLNLGITYRRLGRHHRGIQAIVQAIRLKPDYPEAHYELGLANIHLKNRTMALEQYKILTTLDQNLAQKLFVKIYK